MPTRRNGLSAASYVPLRDLDPRLTEAALEALREAGVAAYAVAASDPQVIGMQLAASPYDRPVDRLFVDTAARDVAAEVIDEFFTGDEPPDGDEPVLAGVTGGSPAAVPDLDLTFEQIVAGFDRAADDHVPSWPAEEDLTTDPTVPTGPAGPADPAGAEVATPAAATTARPADDGDWHFVPPPPPPLPELDPVTKLAWAGVIGGPLILLGSVFGINLSQSLMIFSVIAFVAGFATLVARLKEHPDDADPDDGAVV